MKFLILNAALFLMTIGCSAQQEQVRQIPPFDKIHISGAVAVEYRSSDTLDLKVEAKQKELDQVITEVENGTLKISTKGSVSSEVKVYIQNNHLVSIAAEGASSFKNETAIKENTLSVTASGAAQVQSHVNVEHLETVSEGAADIQLQGNASQLNAVGSGAASIRAYKLTAKNATVQTTGAANVKVMVTEKLKANASGASDIKVKGEPAEISAEATSAASITRVKPSSEKIAEGEGDTTTYSLKRKKVLVIRDREKEEESRKRKEKDQNMKHWRGVTAGVNGYTNRVGALPMTQANNFMELDYSRSFNFQFNPIERQFNIVKNYFKIITGFGIDHHLYSFVNATQLNADTGYTTGNIDTTGQFVYHKNRLRTTYLQVPLMLEFNTSNNPKKTFHLAFGVVGQYLIGSKTKQVLTEKKDRYEKTRKDNYNLNPFGAKGYVGIGYRGFTVFGEYNLTPLFQSKRGPELNPFTIGIRVINFG
jgi:flagellar hook assembly protein FlgD